MKTINIINIGGVTHNDLHQNNILEKDGKYYIIDFALASFNGIVGLQNVFMPEINAGDFMKKAVAVSDYAIINPVGEWEKARRSLINILPQKSGNFGSNVDENQVYHDVNHLFPAGFNIPFQRPYSQNRIEKIFEALPKDANFGVDFGCNAGINCFDLAWRGKKMYGIDYLHDNIEFARSVERIKHFGCDFYEMDIIDLDFNFHKNKFDFALFTSAFQWVIHRHGIEKAKNFLNELSKNIPVMIFDTAQGSELKSEAFHFEDSQAIVNFLKKNTEYNKIVDLGVLDENWQKRNTFLCSKEKSGDNTGKSKKAVKREKIAI